MMINCLRTAACLIAILLAGCRSSPPMWQVAERLGPSQFGVPTDAKVARAIIGSTARPVLGVVPEQLYLERAGISLHAGLAEFALEILPQDIPRTSLSVQTFPKIANPGNVLAESIGKNVFWRRVETGWTITDKGEGQILTVRDLRGTPSEGFLNARLFLTAPSPSKQISQPFALASGTNLRLFFGSKPAPDGTARTSLRYRAALACNEQPVRELLGDGRVDERPGAAWQEARIAIPQGGDECRLTLQVTDLAGAPASDGLWAWPEILVRGPASAVRPNLLLISLDTLRADHMSGYGYPRDTTPAIDRELIGKGTTFLEVFSTFPQTDVSHLSLFTGLYAHAQPTRGRLLPGSPITTIAQNLRAAGYRTNAITENALISGLFGFWRGFDAFTERSVVEKKLGSVSFAAAERYLEANRDQQFFLFLHTYQTHDPYDSSPPFAAMFKNDGHWEKGGPPPYVPDPQQDAVDSYDRTIREADSLVEQLLTSLETNGLADHTLVVLLSDHGESFGEHSVPGHGFAFHDEQLRVPLVIRGPGIPVNNRVSGSTSLTDVAPTILELLGLPPLGQGQGHSLAAAIFGEKIPSDREVFFAWHTKNSIGARNEDWKSISTDQETRNYELETDPFEWHTIKQPALPAGRQAVLDRHREGSAQIREGLQSSLSGDDPSNGGPVPQGIPQRMEESLRALGYLD